MIPFIEKNIVSERFTLKKDTISLMQVTRNIIDLIIQLAVKWDDKIPKKILLTFQINV